MKVLHFHFGKEGGAERFFVALAQAFSRRGVEQRFFIRPNRSWESDIEPLGRVYRNNFSQISPSSLIAHCQAGWQVRQWQPDAVMAWMPRAARLMHAWPNTIKLARLGDFPQNLKHFGNCDLLVGNIPGITERCRELGWTKPATTISNFPRNVQPIPINRSSMTTPEDAFVIAASGRFVQRKGFDTLIRAVSLVDGAILWLLGDGSEKSNLQALCNDLGVADRVRFSGWIDEPIHTIAAADLFVMPSRHEPLGNTLLEAWHAGVPTISTRSEGPSWYMRDGVDGIMTEIDDVVSIAEAIRKIKNNPSLGSQFVRNARQTLDNFFSERAIVESYMNIFSGMKKLT